MHIFDYDKAPASLLTPEITALLVAIHEFKGKQDFFLNAKEEVLNALAEVSKVMSVESSNRIEGVNAPGYRFKYIVQQDVAPRNDDELAILGCREAYSMVMDGYTNLPPNEETILRLHGILFSRLPQSESGVWKSCDTSITEIDGEGRESVRFRTVSAEDTPMAMRLLCNEYAKAIQRGDHNQLLLAIMFVFDFLCIHPFLDGNGRMSRLLTLLLMSRSGYVVGKYVSVDRLVEDSRPEYYESLRQSSVMWHESQNDLRPFVTFMLGIVLKAYRELESRVNGLIHEHTSKSDRIRNVVLASVGTVAKKDIMYRCPDISVGMVEATLRKMQDEGVIFKTGNGRGTAYAKVE